MDPIFFFFFEWSQSEKKWGYTVDCKKNNI